MVHEYQPRRFFREVPNRMLRRYFERHKVLEDVDIGALKETQIEPIHEEWLTLSQEVRNDMEQDFQDVDELATEGGSKAILDEAKFHGEDLTGVFDSLNSFHERAFWTLLERPRYWRGSLAFRHADSVASRFWRKRKNLPRRPANVDPTSIGKFEQAISSYFHSQQGRGQHCKVECYKRDTFDYFFAYPEDYAQAEIVWIKDGLSRRPRRPAFEVIFVYSQSEGTLDTFLSGDRTPVPDLQAIFADTILNARLGPDQKDERVYDLNCFRTRQFNFVYDPESGIEDVVVSKLRLTVLGRKDRITLEADPAHNRQAVFDLMEKVTKGISLAQMVVTQVGIKVTFSHNPQSRRPTTRTFDVGWPSSCSLRYQGRDVVIRRMLIHSGIEPRPPLQDTSSAA
jgi:hypothetical protein